MSFDLSTALQNGWTRVSGWIEGAVSALPNLIAAILVLVLFWLAAKLAARIVHRLLERVSEFHAVNRLLSKLALLGVLAIGFVTALGILNLDKTVTSLLAGAGILGLAIGFAAQDSVENLIAGILLSVRRPFREGQLVSSNDTMGVVQEINLRSVVIRTGGGQIVHIPNSDILDNPLVNYSQSGERRVDVACGVSYADDLEAARRVAVEAIEGLDGRDEDRPVELFYDEFGGSSINFTLRFWMRFGQSNKTYLALRSEAMTRLKQAFDANGVSIPFPITTLDFGIGAGGVSLAEQLGERGG